MTNATKALVIALANATMQAATSFGLDLTDAQQSALVTLVNAALALWIALTYQRSRKRIPD